MEEKQDREQKADCVSVSTQMAEVSLPVRLQPSASVGEIFTECCGEPVVTVRQFCGSRCGCEIVITQTICVSIPVEYGAEVHPGDPCVICRRPGC